MTNYKIYVDTRENVDIHVYCDGACEPNPENAELVLLFITIDN